MNKVCEQESNGKIAMKGGYVKYIFSVFLSQRISDRYNLYKGLKFIKLIAKTDKAVVRGR